MPCPTIQMVSERQITNKWICDDQFFSAFEIKPSPSYLFTPHSQYWFVLKSSADGLFSPCLWLGSRRQHPPDLSCTRSFHSAQTLCSLYVWYSLRIQCISNTSQAYTIKHSNHRCTGGTQSLYFTFLSKNQLQYGRHIYIYRP